ncbi:hypothetical protein LCGC14_2984940 [marine sediment metagenome]|uniref:Uncharacterized protein n=1 Tax=marine sediment metagenome TaxID=412755 RepID=A0A0F8ZWS5_9ZZZZ
MRTDFDRGYVEGYIKGASDHGGITIYDEEVTVENDLLEICWLKELLCVIRECAVSNFDDRAVKLAGKGIGDDFHIPLSRFKEILESL